MKRERNRFREAPNPELEKLIARIADLQKESAALRNEALSREGLLGSNP